LLNGWKGSGVRVRVCKDDLEVDEDDSEENKDLKREDDSNGDSEEEEESEGDSNRDLKEDKGIEDLKEDDGSEYDWSEAS